MYFKITSLPYQRYLLACMLSAFMYVPAKIKAQSHDPFSSNTKAAVKTFNEQVESMMKEVGVPGMSLAVIENNKIVFDKAYGNKQINGERVNRKTIFEGCSLSKSLLVFVAYRLVDEGKLDLDKPMYQYLEYKPLQHDERYKLITPRMILSHCSGIENWKFRNNPRVLEIVSNPGEKYVYSGEGYNYLAKVLEGILHKPYQDYIKEMVTEPLKLKRTFTSYTADGTSPLNYALGHDDYGTEVKKYKNLTPNPACGNHFTAKDYARLIIAIFDQKHLSGNRIKEILNPVIRLHEEDPLVSYGPGFEIIYTPNDTIISHGGDNPGFKNFVFYSVKNKKGLVFLSNSDRGKAMAAQLCHDAVGIDVGTRFNYDFYEQYPGNSITLWRIYNDKGADAMLLKMEELKQSGQLSAKSLNELGRLFIDKDKKVSQRLLEESLRIQPESATAYSFLGDLYMEMKDYATAYKNFVRAKDLHFSLWDLGNNLKECEKNMALQNSASPQNK